MFSVSLKYLRFMLLFIRIYCSICFLPWHILILLFSGSGKGLITQNFQKQFVKTMPYVPMELNKNNLDVHFFSEKKKKEN